MESLYSLITLYFASGGICVCIIHANNTSNSLTYTKKERMFGVPKELILCFLFGPILVVYSLFKKTEET